MVNEHEAWYMCSDIREHITSAAELSRELYNAGYENAAHVQKRLWSAMRLLDDIWMWIEEPLIEVPFD